jgi:V/A-type H+-transporting ATPase subunit C
MNDAVSLIENFMNSPDVFITMLVLGFIIVFMVIIIYLIRYLSETAPYAYVNARVRSMEARLLDENKLNELIESAGTTELINQLEDSDYGPYLLDALGNENDPTFAEKALDTHLAHLYEALAHMSPEGARKILRLFEMKFDVKNIKTLLRAKFVGLDAEQTYALLVPLGSLKDKLRELCETKSVEELASSLEGYEFSKLLSDGLTDYEQTKRLTTMELALDKFILENLWKNVSINGTEKDLFKEYVGTLLDVENLKVILKGKADNLSSEIVLKYVTETGYELASWKLKELAEADSIDGVISGLDSTKYAPLLTHALEEYQKTNSIYEFEKVFDDYVVATGKKLSLRQPFGVGPIIGLITSKEAEIRKLKIIIKGKIEGLSATDIRKLMA